MKNKALIFILLTLLPSFCSCAKVKQYGVEVVNSYSHNPDSYTQGLFFNNNKFYESTGQWGESSFMEVDLATGKAVRRLDFDKKYFVEGSVILDGNLYILTWTNKVAFVYDAATLVYKGAYSYPKEGWGLTTDGELLIASDGSSSIYFLDENFRVKKSLNVKLNGKPVRNLNELEYIDGKIWANVYLTDLILIINPNSGEVEATVDCSGLLPDYLRDQNTDVLNGIAYNPSTKSIYLTGKYWKRLYEIRLK